MVKVLQSIKEDAKEEDIEEEVPARVVQNKISSFNHSSAHNLRMTSTMTQQKISKKRTLMRNKGKLAHL